jgi:hypothetical protein
MECKYAEVVLVIMQTETETPSWCYSSAVVVFVEAGLAVGGRR